MHKPYWMMYSPRVYYNFRRQTLSNLINRYTHMVDDDGRCHYCGGDGDELWWLLPTCRGQAWHIRNFHKPGGPQAFGQHPSTTSNPHYRRK